MRSGAKTPTQLVRFPTPLVGDPRKLVVARGPVGGFEACGLSEPEPVEWSVGRATVHGLLWQPAPQRIAPRVGDDPPRREDGEAQPPLLVHVHGGPTDQVVAEWNARIAYWVSNGWAVLAPNYRGSTGYGRAYRDALRNEWGVRDVVDVASGIEFVGREQRCDPQRVAVAGGSAGGFTAMLLCLQHPELVRAGVSLFGVGDLLHLAASTHRFESRYLDSLVGQLPAANARYVERSPLTHAAKLQVPMLLLQGGADKVVPPAQASSFVRAARAGGGTTVDFHSYAGEGHGFRKQANIIDEYRRTSRFLHRHVVNAAPQT